MLWSAHKILLSYLFQLKFLYCPSNSNQVKVKQGQGSVSRVQAWALRSSRKPEEDSTFQKGSDFVPPPPRAAPCRRSGSRAGVSGRAQVAPGAGGPVRAAGPGRAHRAARGEAAGTDGRTERPARGRGEPPPARCTAA